MTIENFEFFLLRERINEDVDKFSDEIYDIMKNSNLNKFEFSDEIPVKLNINKLIITIKDNIGIKGTLGSLNLGKSKKSSNGKWIIYIDLRKDFKLYSLKHELNHALRLTLIGKDKMISNLNYIKSKGIFMPMKNKEIDNFFYLIYLSNDEELNSAVMETNGWIKEIIYENKISKDDFLYLIQESTAYKNSENMINFNCKNHFNDFNNNELNKFFCILEDNKSELDKIQKSKFSKIKMFIKAFNDILNSKISFDKNDNIKYTPKKGPDFYEKWINSQGEKLKRRLYSLYDHYKES